MAGAVTAGSGLTGCSAAWKGGGAFTVTVSDDVNAGNYTNDRQSTDAFGDMVTIASKLNTGAGTPTATFTAASGSGTAFFGSIAFTEWKSLATSSAADTGASASGGSNAAGNTGTTATLAQTDEVALAVLAYGAEEANAINASGTVGTFVELVTWEGTGNVNSGILYQIVSATTALKHNWTWTSNTAWVGIIETYKGGGGGGGGPTVKALAALGVG